MRKVCVLGGGNLALSTAAYMSLNGYHVALSNRTMEKLEHIKENNNEIEVQGDIQQGTAKIAHIGTLDSCRVHECQLIIVCVPATAHEYWARRILDLDEAPQCPIVLHPGQMHGALQLHSMLLSGTSGLQRATVCELSSSLLTCRTLPETDRPTVFIAAVKARLELATIPAWRNAEVVEALSPLFREQLAPKGNVLHTSLQDLNAVVHPAVTLLNSGSIDRRTPFKFYKEGITVRIAAVIESIDKERLQLAKALCVEVTPIQQWVRDEYGARGAVGETLFELLRSNEAYETIFAPTELDTRYIWEDVPTGMLPMLELADRTHTEMPVMRAVYQLACTMFPEHSFAEEARTLENLGLGHLSLDQLFEYIHTGEARVLTN